MDAARTVFSRAVELGASAFPLQPSHFLVLEGFHLAAVRGVYRI